MLSSISPMAPLIAQFNARVEKFLQRAGFKPTEFGRQAIADPTLVVDLCTGGVRRSWRRPTGSSSSSRPRGGSSRRSNGSDGCLCLRCNPMNLFTTHLQADRTLETE